jgi:predicted ABC-type ATPase
MSNEPIMSIVAGTNGAGKSTFISKPIFEGGGYIIDPDAIAKSLNPRQPEKARLQAGRFSIQLIEQMIQNKQSFVMETTLSGRLPFLQIQAAKKQGFRIVMHYIGLDRMQRHIDRVRERVQMGGHDIPVEDIIRRYERSQHQLYQTSQLVDQLILWDNTFEARDLLEIKDGKVEYLAEEIPDWVEHFLARRN